MKTKAGLPVHLVVVGTATATVVIVAALFFFRQIMRIFESYHGVFVVGFVVVVSLWSYWAAYAIIRRKVEASDARSRRQP